MVRIGDIYIPLQFYGQPSITDCEHLSETLYGKVFYTKVVNLRVVEHYEATVSRFPVCYNGTKEEPYARTDKAHRSS